MKAEEQSEDHVHIYFMWYLCWNVQAVFAWTSHLEWSMIHSHLKKYITWLWIRLLVNVKHTIMIALNSKAGRESEEPSQIRQ